MLLLFPPATFVWLSMHEKTSCTLPPVIVHCGSTEYCTAFVAAAGGGFEVGVEGTAAAAAPRFLFVGVFGFGVAGATTAQPTISQIFVPSKIR